MGIAACNYYIIVFSPPASIYIIMGQNLIYENIAKNHNDNIIPL